MTPGSHIATPAKKCGICGSADFYSNGKCRPCRLETNRAWRARNKEKVKAKDRAWKEKNSLHVSEVQRKYRQSNSDHVRDVGKAYRENNKEKIALKNRNRRARERGATGNIQQEWIDQLLVLQRGRCACCGDLLNGVYHLDHIFPLVLGGGNERSNLQLLLPSCNLRKNRKHPVDYMQSKGLLL